MSGSGQVKPALVENLRELHLQAMLACFEDTARRAEKETFSYEQYLLELSERGVNSGRAITFAGCCETRGCPWRSRWRTSI